MQLSDDLIDEFLVLYKKHYGVVLDRDTAALKGLQLWKMIKGGFIKIFRREVEWMKQLSNAEIVYLVAARAATEWNSRSDLFGTFDARIKEMQKHLEWADGTISRVTNLLKGKGILQVTEDSRRLRITNAHLFFSKGPKGKEAEKIIRDAEQNLQTNELDIRIHEYFQDKLLQGINDLKDKMSVRGCSKKKK
jgi:hypothetical protein